MFGMLEIIRNLQYEREGKRKPRRSTLTSSTGAKVK